jgi:hypothetical protein
VHLDGLDGEGGGGRHFGLPCWLTHAHHQCPPLDYCSV